MPFRFSARNVFLTYPRCNLPLQTLLEELQKLPHLKYHTLGREAHADGTPHLHALLQFSKKIDTTDERYFDAKGFHPNIQGARSLKDVYNYVTKEGETLSNWKHEERKRPSIEFEDATSKEEYIKLWKENEYKHYVTFRDRIDSYADTIYKRPESPVKGFSNPFLIPEPLSKWTRENLNSEQGILYNPEMQNLNPKPF